MSKKASLEKILKKGSYMVLPLLFNSLDANSKSLIFNAPSERENGNILVPTDDMKGYPLYRQVDKEGWHFLELIPQNGPYTIDGTRFVVPLSAISEGSTAEYKIRAQDNEGLLSPYSKIVTVKASDFGYSTPNMEDTSPTLTDDSFLIDLSQLPKDTYGNFSFLTGNELYIESNNDFRDGFFYEFQGSNLEEKVSSIGYNIDSDYSAIIRLQIMGSGNHWYYYPLRLKVGENKGNINLSNFMNETISDSVTPYSSENLIKSVAITGEDNTLYVEEISFKK